MFIHIHSYFFDDSVASFIAIIKTSISMKHAPIVLFAAHLEQGSYIVDGALSVSSGFRERLYCLAVQHKF